MVLDNYIHLRTITYACEKCYCYAHCFYYIWRYLYHEYLFE